MGKVLKFTRQRFHEIEPSLICNDVYFEAVYQLLQLFPQSLTMLSEILRYVHCYLEGHIAFPCQLALRHLQAKSDQGVATLRCRIFVTFVRYFATDFLYTQCPELLAPIDTVLQQDEQIEAEDDSHLLLMPTKAKQYFSTQQKEKMLLANDLLTKFNTQVRSMRD
jgi:hypothetical protein